MNRVFTIGGFTETARDSTGLEEVHRRHIAPYDDDPAIDVQPVRPWKDDWKGVAARAKRDGIKSVIIVAYSWGAGWGAQKLAKALKQHWITVELMLLCDPVYRPTWLPSWGFANLLGFRALIPGSATIKVPSNVKRLVGLRQTNKRPCGHPLKWQKHTVHLPKVENATHTSIDSSPAWFDLVESEMLNLFGPP